MRNITSPRANPRRPLAHAVLLAITTFAAGSALAGDLDNQDATVVAGDPVEAWSLRNGSNLIGQNAQMNEISARDTSTVVLDGGTVIRAAGQRAVSLTDNAQLTATGTTFRGGIALNNGNTVARLTGGSIKVTAADLAPTERLSVGIDLLRSLATSDDRNPYALLDGVQVEVEDAPDPTAPVYNSGVGARVFIGRLDITNGSSIASTNAGVLLWNEPHPDGTVTLNVDRSTIASQRGPAIQVMPGFDSSNADILIANGSTLTGGDGNLLLFSNLSGSINSSPTDVNFTVDNSRLAGNVTFDPTTVSNGTLDVILRNKAQIDGRFTNVTSADIGSDSTWLMTGDSNVGALILGSTGIVALGNGSTFNTLNVDTFTGNGGTLLFNTVLFDDTSATDKLIVAGDTSGQANVRVVNAGGAGAKTDKGIELIRVGGASNGQFDLQGRAVGGQYEYFLFKDAANGGWYLRSELATVPDPCVVDPTLPECGPIIDPVDPVEPTPVLRPETGAYLANQFAVDQLLRHGWRDRQGGSFSDDGVRGWARVDSNQSKLGAVNDQLDLRVDRSRVQLGADMGVFDNGRGRVGVMGTLAQSSATSRSELTGYSAKGKVQGGALGVYGSWNNDAMYLDASVQRGQFRNRVQGEGLAEERYDSDIWQSALEAGYRIGIGQIGSTTVSLQPELQLIYTNTSTDRHEEANGTVVRALDNNGLSGRLGLRLQGEGHSTAGASVSPYVVANWYRDGANNGIAFDDELLKAGIPRNRYELSAGARVQFRSGLSAWGGFGVMRGDHGYRETTANLSVAYQW
ncbi:TPA: autotransporter outer membrane beta-barrel domain-containing protein [Stenotrophomonas maltophilia]|uniref:autotransporter family protein n=1 Tax=Stenotrophomonas sp. Sm6012 TaxID=3002745 RepID=UPI001313B18F|nr:autotransporter outer membrane beta-barrel domain-containing protein [Stenotrophomonas sp. Sm6012]MDQ7283271.1 autotransporter outer membrane beta-barrel domain-containing protein [Stenotrophomonas sp. Sm6012]HEL3181065.1 autotransporter outer membrane beta-barrel domain-containing protein [Stenotrophomonas maltophilia]